MITLSDVEARAVVVDTKARAQALAKAANALNGRMVEIADRYEWSSFDPADRAQLSTLHTAIQRISESLTPYV